VAGEPQIEAERDARVFAEGLREAVEWLSVNDTRRMVRHGSPGAVYQTMLTHRTGKSRRVEHHRVIAETDPDEVLAMCDLVEQEETSGPDIFALIDARKQGRSITRPHDDENTDG
jgi:hypothetical protein